MALPGATEASVLRSPFALPRHAPFSCTAPYARRICGRRTDRLGARARMAVLRFLRKRCPRLSMTWCTRERHDPRLVDLCREHTAAPEGSAPGTARHLAELAKHAQPVFEMPRLRDAAVAHLMKQNGSRSAPTCWSRRCPSAGQTACRSLRRARPRGRALDMVRRQPCGSEMKARKPKGQSICSNV